MPDLLAPLADGALTGTAFGNHVLIAATAVAFATKRLPPILSCFAIAGTGDALADVHGIRVSRVLKRGCLIGARGF